MKSTINAYGVCDIGNKRKENQDSLRMADDIGLFIVADGAGGMDFGGQASDYAASRLSLNIRIALEELEETSQKTSDNIKKMLIDQIRTMNAKIIKTFGKNTATTVVIALIQNNTVFITHAGDSRAYLFKRDVLHQLTNDHNFAAALVSTGELTKEEAARHWSSCQLLSSLGILDEETCPVVVDEIDLGCNARILLCSDGVTGMITDATITEVLQTNKDTKSAASALVRKSLEAGGNDNIAVIVVDITV